MLGNVHISLEILIDGKARPKLQQCADGQNLLFIWAHLNKSMPKNEQKKKKKLIYTCFSKWKSRQSPLKFK